ncbi:MAG TPA: HNH endonuclease [Propionibacteriaceae bacterium]
MSGYLPIDWLHILALTKLSPSTRLVAFTLAFSPDDVHVCGFPEAIIFKHIDLLVQGGWLDDRGGLSDLVFKTPWGTPQPPGRPRRNPIPAPLRALVIERDGLVCQICDATVRVLPTYATDQLTLDHIVPWSKGGADTIENLRVACAPCNIARGNQD